MYRRATTVRFNPTMRIFFIVGSAFFCFLLFAKEARPTSDPVVAVIVNQKVPQTNIRKNTLRAIFGMRLQAWSDGTPIVVFILQPKNQFHVHFSKKTLDVFPHQLERSWDRLVFSGTGQAPIIVRNQVDMLEKVARTPGAIGYIKQDYANETVRTLSVH